MIDPLLFATAVEGVLRAGAIQMAYLGTGFEVRRKGAIDLVTEVDLTIERTFRATVAERFPDHQVLGEEFGGDEGAGSSHRWVFDPLDGTTNYAHGLPIFAASLALEIDGVRALGAVYDPCRRELFTAVRGGGAFLNGVPLRVSTTSELLDALLVTGFPYTVHNRARDMVALFEAFLGRVQAVRRLGSAALDLCYVAAGRMDGFWEQHLKPWDTAAGALVLEEAGGCITGIDGTPFDPYVGHLMASNGALHARLLDVVSRFWPNGAPRLSAPTG